MNMFRIFFFALLVAASGLLCVHTMDAVPPSNTQDGATRPITFGDLSFPVTDPDQVKAGGTESLMSYGRQIPESIRAFDGRSVVIEGYMVPTKLEKEKVREFIVVSSLAACCYGVTPNINEYIVAKMTGNATQWRENVPLRFEGILKVGDIYTEDYWLGIYHLDCVKVTAVE